MKTLQEQINKGYELIPMSEITDEAREIAVRWMECEDKDWIGQKHKLASDIMNYAKRYHAGKLKEQERKKYDANLCCICHGNFVDSANGYDTCDYCAKRI